MAGMEACRSAGRATGREKRPSLCPCRHCIMRLLRNLCRLCSEPPYHRDDGEALYIRVYCLYYLPAAPVNFIFRDRDWRLIEKNRNTGPALASGLRPGDPASLHVTSQAPRRHPPPPPSYETGRPEDAEVTVAACVDSVLVTCGTVGCTPEGLSAGRAGPEMSHNPGPAGPASRPDATPAPRQPQQTARGSKAGLRLPASPPSPLPTTVT